MEAQTFDAQAILNKIRGQGQGQVSSLECGIWSMKYGVWNMEYEVWSVE